MAKVSAIAGDWRLLFRLPAGIEFKDGRQCSVLSHFSIKHKSYNILI